MPWPPGAARPGSSIASRGLDLTCIDAHNYYPNLLPLLLSYLYFALGQVNDSLVKVIFPLWGALLLGLLYSLAAPAGPEPPVTPWASPPFWP